jgi:iron-sulfur cluster assembly protein
LEEEEGSFHSGCQRDDRGLNPPGAKALTNWPFAPLCKRVVWVAWGGWERDMIHVTEKAATKIQELLAKEGVAQETGGLRVGVQGGGCSGLTYAMRLETQARDRDKVVEENGARLFVDPKSFLYLNETTLDYQEDLMRRGFVFQNPQATRSCGCGSSFTV